MCYTSCANTTTQGAHMIHNGYLTTHEAAERLGVTSMTILRWRAKGILRGMQIGTPTSPVWIEESSVQELVERGKKAQQETETNEVPGCC
ncbi:MAG: helix-turn-helix domain-containing protein [Planctomycetota bacterium]